MAKAYEPLNIYCSSCGAPATFDVAGQVYRCAYCGRNMVRQEYLDADGFPEILIPFKVTQDEARANLLAWCAGNKAKPEARDIKRHIHDLTGFYLPYELVKGPVAADVSRRESKVYRCRGFWEGSFVNTSKQLDNLLLDGMEPYDHPLVRYRADDGRLKRFRGPRPTLRSCWDTVKPFVLSPFVLVILFLLLVLSINTVLILHWDSF